MHDKFTIISLTPPEPKPGEAQKITKMLQSGVVDFVHLRHPEAEMCVIEDILNDIPEHLHDRIRLHSHFDLLDTFQVAGAHLNNRWPVCDNDNAHSLTRSCHSLFELWNIDQFEYVTLSPIYTSISKPGYIGHFSRKALSMAIRGKRVVALGGVSPDKFSLLRKAGFYGAGMLGYLWQDEYERSLRQIKMFKNDSFRLHYITNKPTPEEVAEEVKQVLDGGCRWIQIRMKEAPDEVIAKAVELVAPMCRAVGSILVLDDRVELAAKLPDVDGVHIGKEDMAPLEARRILGDLKIIGCSANTFDDICEINNLGVADYIELGPLHVNQTKRKEQPTLGYEISLEIFNRLHEWTIDIPITVIGGVTLKDVHRMLDLGAQGVAVGGSIRNAPDHTAATRAFITELS